MGSFHWISEDDIPKQLDLRSKGWLLAEPGQDTRGCVLVVHTAGMNTPHGTSLVAAPELQLRRQMLICGANSASERGALLGLGFGDVVSDDVGIVELDARARRLAELSSLVPRRRSLARLELDILTREAFLAGKALGLHPREFGVLWRLSESPDLAVSKQALIEDVWRLRHLPESNSIAVHVSRLRSKLTAAGLPNLVEAAKGGYRLRTRDST